MQRSMVTETGTVGWTNLDEKEMQQMSQRKILKGATSLMDLSCMPSSCNLLNTITPPSTPESSGQKQKMLITASNFSILSPSCSEHMMNYEDRSREHQTLQLFPPRNDDLCSIGASAKEFKELLTTINSNLPPNKFYEFL